MARKFASNLGVIEVCYQEAKAFTENKMQTSWIIDVARANHLLFYAGVNFMWFPSIDVRGFIELLKKKLPQQF